MMSTETIRVLLVDDDHYCLESLGDYLELEGYETLRYADGRHVIDGLDSIDAHVAVVDLRMPHISGMELLPLIAENLGIPVIMLTAYGDVGTAVEAVQQGAHDFRLKPMAPEAIVTLVRNAVEHQHLKSEVSRLRAQVAERHGPNALIGESPSMRRIHELLRRIGPSESSVIVFGETGTGKELVALVIHYYSERSSGPFVAVNCATTAGDLAPADFFGHERGAFTGAVARRSGYFEQARGGTLFLDEVGCLPEDVQAMLLRTLETRRYQPVGSSTSKTADVRIVSATNQDLHESVRSGVFRQDLFFRLAVVPIRLPPLRERREDIVPLCRHLIAELDGHRNRSPRAMAPCALEKLQNHRWPGNVRELRNVIEHALLVCDHGMLRAEDLALKEEASPGDGMSFDELPPFDEARERLITTFERSYLRSLITHCGGNLTRACRISGMNYRTLQRKLKHHHIDRRSFDS